MSEKSSASKSYVILVLAIAVASRLLPHLPNVTALGALGLVLGSSLPKKLQALVLSLLALFVSDLVLGFHNTMLYVYGSMAVSVALGQWWLKRWSWQRLCGASLANSLLFFIVTNFGVWFSSGLYPKTAAGLVSCFTLAIPFFGNQVVADLAFLGAFVGLKAAMGATARQTTTLA